MSSRISHYLEIAFLLTFTASLLTIAFVARGLHLTEQAGQAGDTVLGFLVYLWKFIS